MKSLEEVANALMAQAEELDDDIDVSIRCLADKARERADSVAMNTLWCYWAIYQIHRLYRQAYKDMRQGAAESGEVPDDGRESPKELAYERAWMSLADCEQLINDLARNYCIAGARLEDFHIEAIMRDIDRLQPLFPYRYFLSVGGVIEQRKCSICGKEVGLRDACGHLQGRLYDGKLCRYIVVKARAKEISIVENPKDKKCILKVDGVPYRFPILDEVVRRISPFATWSYTVDKVLMPEYQAVGDQGLCPCGSGLSYAECIRRDPEKHQMPHYVFQIPLGAHRDQATLWARYSDACNVVCDTCNLITETGIVEEADTASLS